VPKTDKELNIVDGLVQMSFLIHGMLERRAAEQDLSIIQTRLLGILRDRTPTMKELGQLLGLDKSSITGLVDRAERRGLVNRTPSRSDGRAVLVTLTAAGRKFIARASAQFEADVHTVLDYVSEAERRSLAKTLSHMLVAQAADHGIDLLNPRMTIVAKLE
jgi:MarR family transcriptional regulator, lower aerobic nicotinate degradation pathway regulator